MLIPPITPIHYLSNPPKRAFIAIAKAKGIVIDGEDKVSPEMSPGEAWVECERLNINV
jgi:hypothetical protein